MQNFELTNSELLSEDFESFLGIGKKKKKKKKKKKIFKGVGKKLGIGQGKVKAKLKKVTKKIKDKKGKIGKPFRNKFRKILRKGVLKNLERNVHGYATRFYPAINPKDAEKMKFRKSYIAKADKNYKELVKKWVKLGGDEDDLKAAITKGAKKRRFFRAVPKSGADGYTFYDIITPDVDIYSGDNGEEFSDEDGIANLETGEEELPTQEETKKGIRGFFAWIRGLFRRNDSTENPYADGSDGYNDFADDENADKSNLPDESEADNEISRELEDTAGDDDAGGDSDEDSGDDSAKKGDTDTILGIPKIPFWIGVSVLGLGAIIGGIYLIRRK